MRKRIGSGLPILIAVLVAFAVEARAQRAVILVRHAERLDQSADSLLSPAGIERANALADRLKDAGINAIYTSDRQRTIRTAAPLAVRLKIKPVVVAASDSRRLVETIRKDNADDVVLIVGHSNTVPELITAFGVNERITIADSGHDNLFVLLPETRMLLRLRY